MADRSILTPEVLRQLLRYDPETGILHWRVREAKWFKSGYRTAEGNCALWNANFAGKEAFTAQIYGTYKISSVLSVRTNAHRVAYSMYHDVSMATLREIDHINGDKADNRITNLREVAHSENAKNVSLYRTNKSGVHGVMWEKTHKAWAAKISINGKQKRIGRFKCFGQAVEARKNAEIMHGYHANHGRVSSIGG